MTRELVLTSQAAEGDSQSIDRTARQNMEREGDSAADMSTSDPIDAPVVPEPNEDPARRRIANPTRGLAKLYIKVRERITPPMTAEDRAALEDAQRIKLLNSVLREEAKVTEWRLKNALHNLGYSYVVKGSDGSNKKIKHVEFYPVVSTEDAHWLHVDMDKLPYGVNSSDLIKQDILDHLGRAVGHKVSVRSNDEVGIWFIVERASGMMGLPAHVKISEMWERFPVSANGLTLPLGMTHNRKAIYNDLDDLVHILVAGETGGGKSNTQAIIITTLAKRNKPDHLQMLLLDMKARMEFQFFEGLPHLLKIPDVTDDGIIEDPDMVYPAFQWLLNYEAKRRMQLIRSAKHRSIADYNTRRKNPLPRLLVVCDEWGTARLADKGKEAETELAKAVMLLRAAGIHIMIGTQTPTKEVLGLLVRSNLPTKICHNCNELSASAIVVGDGSALGLPVGRAILKRGGMKLPIQMPYISEHLIKEVVSNIISGKEEVAPTKSHDVTLDDMLIFGLQAMGGSLGYREIHKHFSHRGISQHEVRDTLAELEGQEVTVDGKLFRVDPGSAGRPRRLVATEESEEQTNE